MALNNGTLIHLVAREGKQDEVAAILGEALGSVARDPQTATWYAYRITNTEFGIFGSSESKAPLGQDGHPVLTRLSDDLLAHAPSMQSFDVLVSKV
ncbi:antibiotic biosynthesis monooxygenase [Rhodococcus fascians]|nr:antibiotic biosynthesis monooxygenase [Rhodococcus fascians]MBY4024446.1 antibiotic biosynthesis monooxygenase [Rhodococcus fascians]